MIKLGIGLTPDSNTKYVKYSPTGTYYTKSSFLVIKEPIVYLS